MLIFVDADTVVPAPTLRATLAAWRAGAVGGGASVHLDGRLPLSARLSMPGFRLGMRVARLAAGCYVFCTREAFDAAGGFDARLFAGEELAFSRSLSKQGRFVVLRERVTSSGRKLRTHSVWELFKLLISSVARGPAIMRSRDHLDLWYGARGTIRTFCRLRVLSRSAARRRPGPTERSEAYRNASLPRQRRQVVRRAARPLCYLVLHDCP